MKNPSQQRSRSGGERPPNQSPASHGSTSRRGWLRIATIAFVLFAASFLLLNKSTPPSSAKKVHVIDPNTPPVSAELKIRPPQPQSLAELLALPPDQLEHVDLAVLNLLCATGLRGAEHLNVQQDLDTLDTWARHVAAETLRNFPRFARNPDEYGGSLASYRMMMLATVLQQDFRAHYSPNRARPQLRGEREPDDAFFVDSREVLLHGLLGGDRAGACSSLPVLYVAVAQRLGYPVSLAAVTGHLYVRYEDGDKHLNVEATSLGYNSYPDEHYRKWPYPTDDAEAREYGLLRPKTKAEMLGAFLIIRAQTLTSAKRFAEAADTWEQAARFLPTTTTLTHLVTTARSRVAHEKAADRWDELLDEVQRLRVPTKPDYAELRDRQLRLRWFMNQNTNVAAIEQAVDVFKTELNAAWQREALAADSRLIIGTNGSMVGSVERNFPHALSQPRVAITTSPETLEAARAALAVQAERIKIPAERVPWEYRQGPLPAELLQRLQGIRAVDEIVLEMDDFHREQVERRNREVLAGVPRPGYPLPPGVQVGWLPEPYRENLPEGLHSRLSGRTTRAEVELAVRNYEQLLQTERERTEGSDAPRRQSAKMPG